MIKYLQWMGDHPWLTFFLLYLLLVTCPVKIIEALKADYTCHTGVEV